MPADYTALAAAPVVKLAIKRTIQAKAGRFGMTALTLSGFLAILMKLLPILLPLFASLLQYQTLKAWREIEGDVFRTDGLTPEVIEAWNEVEGKK